MVAIVAEVAKAKKTRRSSAEKALAQHILARADGKTPDTEAFAVAKRYGQKAMKNSAFAYRRRSRIDGLMVHRFRKEGESVVGTVGDQTRREWWAETTIPFVLDSGRIMLLPGNRRLIGAIKKAKAWNLRVKITYVGKLRTSGGHFEKVYMVESKPLGK